MKLRRLRRNDDGLTRYAHPNHWSIRQCRRDWSLRGFERGALGGTAASAPLIWWEVYRYATSPAHIMFTSATLREAREWCDTHHFSYATGQIETISVSQPDRVDCHTRADLAQPRQWSQSDSNRRNSPTTQNQQSGASGESTS